MTDAAQNATGWHDAGREAYWAWEALGEAKTLSEQAMAVDRLSNAMANLVSWLPGWDWEHGILKDPGWCFECGTSEDEWDHCAAHQEQC